MSRFPTVTSPRFGPTTITTGKQARALGLSKVPRVAAIFWITKALTTAMGESTSDFLVHALSPVAAVLLGFVAFCVALVVQLRTPRYSAARYWFAVSMVGVFGTMAADVLHVGFGVPYPVSAVLFVIVLGGVFVTWHRVEGTLSVHTDRDAASRAVLLGRRRRDLRARHRGRRPHRALVRAGIRRRPRRCSRP